MCLWKSDLKKRTGFADVAADRGEEAEGNQAVCLQWGVVVGLAVLASLKRFIT